MSMAKLGDLTYFSEMAVTVVSEIHVPRVCGGSKIAQIQKIQKMLFPLELLLSTFKRL